MKKINVWLYILTYKWLQASLFHSRLLQQDQLCDCAESVVGELNGSERWLRQAEGRRHTTEESYRERECAIEREREKKKKEHTHLGFLECLKRG